MKIVLQRVLNASVTVDNNVIGAIDKGLLIFLGIEADDTDDMLQKYADKIIKLRIFEDENGNKQELDANTPVSMNMWGFTPDYFEYSEEYFINFLKEFGQEMKSEFYIPTMVNYLINNSIAKVKALDTTSKWFGVTYADDRVGVVEKLQLLVNAGEYPTPLFV